jgi:hypothetical protein
MENTTRPYTSSIRYYFEVSPNNENKAICLICHYEISRGTNKNHLTNSNLKYHLEKEHHKLFQRMIEVDKCLSGKRTYREMINNKTSLANFVNIKSINNESKAFDSNIITNLICKMIISDLLPFSIVENEGFSKLLSTLVPDYIIPSRTAFSRSLMPKLFKDEQNRISTLLASSTYISLSGDIWTSRAGDSYFNIQASTIADNFQKNKLILDFVQIKGPHTAENLHNFDENIIKRWGIG